MNLKTTLFLLLATMLSVTASAGKLTYTMKGVAISTEYSHLRIYDQAGIEIENENNLPAGTYSYKAMVNYEGIGDIEKLGTTDYCNMTGNFDMPEGNYNLELDFSSYESVSFTLSNKTFPCYTNIYDPNNKVMAVIGGEEGLSGDFILYCPPGNYRADLIPLEAGYKALSVSFSAQTNSSPVNMLLEQGNIFHVIVMVSEASERPINGAKVELGGYPAITMREDIPFCYIPNISENNALPVKVTCPGYITVNTTINVSQATADPDLFYLIPLQIIMKKDLQGITTGQTNRIRAYSLNGNIILTGTEQGENISIYNLDGTLSGSFKADGATVKYPVTQKGAYIVSVRNNTTLKVLVF